MKKLKSFITILLSFLLISLLTLNASAAQIKFNKPDAVVNLENKELENILKEELGLKKSQKLKISDVLEIKTLILDEETIFENLNDLAYFPNLAELYLFDQKNLENLNGIENCVNLKALTIDGCSFSDVSAISKVSSLEYVEINDTPITDASAVFSLPNLTGFFSTGGTYISDISALKGNTTLTGFRLNSPELKDISVLKDIDSLRLLWIENADKIPLKQFSMLKNLQNLQVIVLGNMNLGNGIGNYIAQLKELKYLYLYGNNIKNYTFLKSLKNLVNFSKDPVNIFDVFDRIYYQTMFQYCVDNLNNMLDLPDYADILSLIDFKGILNLIDLNNILNLIYDETYDEYYILNQILNQIDYSDILNLIDFNRLFDLILNEFNYLDYSDILGNMISESDYHDALNQIREMINEIDFSDILNEFDNGGISLSDIISKTDYYDMVAQIRDMADELYYDILRQMGFSGLF